MNNQIQAITTESAHVRIWQTTNYIAAALIALVYEYSYSVILYEANKLHAVDFPNQAHPLSYRGGVPVITHKYWL